MTKILNHHNDLNKVRLNNFTKQEYEIFFLLLEQMQKQNQDVGEEFNNIISLDILDIKKFMEINDLREQSLRTQTFFKSVEQTLNKISKIDFRSRTPRSIKVVNLFLGFEIDCSSGKVTVDLNKDCEYLFFRLAGQFMALDLDKYIALKKIHSRNLFRLLSQWKNSEHKSFSISTQDLKLFFNVEDYENKIFHRDVLDPAIKENSLYFKDLKKETIKNGKSIVEYKFSWSSFTGKEKKIAEKKKESFISPSQKPFETLGISEYKKNATDAETSLERLKELREMMNSSITAKTQTQEKTQADLKKAIKELKGV